MDICKVCLSKDAVVNLVDGKFPESDEQFKTGLQILLYCIDIEPVTICPKLCIECHRKLISFYKFKLLAHRNHSSYKLHYYNETCDNSEVLVKVENDLKILEGFEFLDVKAEECEINLKTDNEINLDLSDNDCNGNESIVSLEEPELENPKIKPKVRAKRKRKKDPKTKLKVTTDSQICDECGKFVKNLRNHMKSHLPTTEKKVIPCHGCSKTFTDYSSRNKHNKNKHLGKKQHCDICNKDFVYLRAHYLMVHLSDELKHECFLCKKKFYSNIKLEEHMRLHTNTRPYECADCGNRFRTKLCLTTHIRSVHIKERSHLCQFCPKGFYKKNALKEHLRTHTKEKPYQCRMCDKTFCTSSQVKCHEVKHSGVKSVACSHCDMTFYNITALKAHMVSHTRERRHECQYCGLKFGRSDHRKRHEWTAHGGPCDSMINKIISTATK